MSACESLERVSHVRQARRASHDAVKPSSTGMAAGGTTFASMSWGGGKAGVLDEGHDLAAQVVRLVVGVAGQDHARGGNHGRRHRCGRQWLGRWNPSRGVD